MTVAYSPSAIAKASTTAAATSSRAVAVWLFSCCAMIFAMVLIGGITRLTESGLSIVRWEPIGGALPPLSAADWQILFDQYRETPQFRFVNPTMSLAEFETIFWWEYIHRLWGRAIGLVFVVPLLWFWARGQISRSLRWPMVGFFALGAVQGAIGWWMVASGLKDVPWVSPYRLTTHLGFALVLYSGLLWVGMGVWRQSAVAPTALAGIARDSAVSRVARVATGLVFLTILAGGFVAGLDAGLIYNEFPLMGSGLVPSDYRDELLSWVANLFENRAAVQFHHRILAVITVIGALSFAIIAWRRSLDTITRRLAVAFAVTALVQMVLGIATLILQVPVWLGATHQAGAVILLTLGLIACYRQSKGRLA